MRLKIDGSVVYEIGAPEFYYDWNTGAVSAGDHSIIVEVSDQTDTSWNSPQRTGIVYTLQGNTLPVNHAPNRPILVANPAYDWFVTIGNPPQICTQAQGDPDITFVGAVLEGRPRFYANSSVYACPTTKASFGITLLESMACETPVVCSDILGFRDVVANEREALMVPCGDRDALADSLVRVLDDEGLAIELGTTGRQNSLEYSWARVTSRVLDVYQNVLGHVPVAV